ncbi:MAG: FHA domain-containing protein [Planctomycetes bacterium]|nr:FHA domain-containing protein [Planctomycetota bacterium]
MSPFRIAPTAEAHYDRGCSAHAVKIARVDVAHITFSSKTRSKPSVEFYSDGASEPRRVTIDKCPFRIGRVETSDLRIDSAQVSREHAEIVERSGVWLIRDLGSMNGTQVNGKRVTEAMLADGDIVKLAETELTFLASAAAQFQRMATQPSPSRDLPYVTKSVPAEIVAARALIEATLWQAIPIELNWVVSFRHSTMEAVFTGLSTNEGLTNPQPLFRSNHCAGLRYRELYRQRSLELARERSLATRLFVPVDAAEIESPNPLLVELERIQDVLPSGWELGITISLPVVLESTQVGGFYQTLRNQGLLIAYDQFQGNGGQVMQIDALVPDYLVLSESMTKGLHETRQPMRRLESVIAVCEELAIKPVLPPCNCERTIDLCRQSGCDLMLHKRTTLNRPGVIAPATPRDLVPTVG